MPCWGRVQRQWDNGSRAALIVFRTRINRMIVLKSRAYLFFTLNSMVNLSLGHALSPVNWRCLSCSNNCYELVKSFILFPTLFLLYSKILLLFVVAMIYQKHSVRRMFLPVELGHFEGKEGSWVEKVKWWACGISPVWTSCITAISSIW